MIVYIIMLITEGRDRDWQWAEPVGVFSTRTGADDALRQLKAARPERAYQIEECPYDDLREFELP